MFETGSLRVLKIQICHCLCLQFYLSDEFNFMAVYSFYFQMHM